MLPGTSFRFLRAKPPLFEKQNMDGFDASTLPVYLIFVLLLIDRMINFARTLKNGATPRIQNGALTSDIIETKLLVKELHNVCVKLADSYEKNTKVLEHILTKLDSEDK